MSNNDPKVKVYSYKNNPGFWVESFHFQFILTGLHATVCVRLYTTTDQALFQNHTLCLYHSTRWIWPLLIAGILRLNNEKVLFGQQGAC